jgi:hypothetical protein
MSTLNVPGAQLSYEVSGSGPLLILIPGARGVGRSSAWSHATFQHGIRW